MRLSLDARIETVYSSMTEPRRDTDGEYYPARRHLLA